jgi:hypothetical protein
VAERRLRKLDREHERQRQRQEKAVTAYGAKVVTALERALDSAKAGKLPESQYGGDLRVPCALRPERLPKRSREACDLERTIATLKIGADPSVNITPDEAAYYFGPCEV